jgi:hypothetical protein
LDSSLALIREDCPPAYAQLCRLLAPRQVQLHVDREALWLSFTPHAAALHPGQAPDPAITIRFTRLAILDMLDAKLTLQDAIQHGRIGLQGDLHHLTLFYEGWLTYLRGAVRCPAMPALLDDYRLAPA